MEIVSRLGRYISAATWITVCQLIAGYATWYVFRSWELAFLVSALTGYATIFGYDEAIFMDEMPLPLMLITMIFYAIAITNTCGFDQTIIISLPMIAWVISFAIISLSIHDREYKRNG